MFPLYSESTYKSPAVRFRYLPSKLVRYRVMILVAVTALITSCSQKELVMPDEGDCLLTVRFEWDEAPDAAPDGMTLYFFPLGEDEMIWRFDIAGGRGGNLELPCGSYSMIAYNNDLPRIDFTSRDSYAGFTAVARRLPDGHVAPPGCLYGGFIPRIDVSHRGVKYQLSGGEMADCAGGPVRCWPRCLSVIYRIEVRRVTGMECLRSATVCLDGLAGALRLVSDTPLGNPVKEDVVLENDGSDSLLSAVLTGFGSAPDVTDYLLTVRCVCTDGSCFEKSFDVSAQILNSSDSKNVVIIVDGLDIPKNVTPSDPGEDVGIEVGVDGWSEIQINLGTDSRPLD